MNHVVKKELNNKGFSLMELIIVIAIMAVLIGVLAPQYLKYVEKSRESADLQALDTMVSAVEIYSASNPVDGTLKSTNGIVSTTGTNVSTALTEAGITLSSTEKMMKSTKYAGWEISFSSTGVSTADADLAKALSITHSAAPAPAGP